MTNLRFRTKIVIFFIGLCFWGHAQTSNNPFELSPRLPKGSLSSDTTQNIEKENLNPFELKTNSSKEEEITVEPVEPQETQEADTNPFDLVSPAQNSEKTSKSYPTSQTIEETQAAEIKVPNGQKAKPSLFIITLFNLLFFTLLFTIFRSYILKIYSAVFNDNMLNQLFNDRLNTGLVSAISALYLLFFLNFGLFIYLILAQYQQLPDGNQYIQLLSISGGLIALFILKHISLAILGNIFPIWKEAVMYNFSIIIFSILIGLILVPFNLSIAYAPSNISEWLTYLALFCIALIYLLHITRSIFIANKFLVFHKFHFLLYICTLEIAPVLILYRLIVN